MTWQTARREFLSYCIRFVVGVNQAEFGWMFRFQNSKRATLTLVDTFEKTLVDAITVKDNESPDPAALSASADGDIITSLDWSTQQEKSLPLGTVGASVRTGLAGPTITTPKSRSAEWKDHGPSGDMGEAFMSPVGTLSGKSKIHQQSPSLLEDDDEISSDLLGSCSPSFAPLQPTADNANAAQARLSASRAKHSKNISLPSHLLAGKGPRSDLSAPGLGLESLNERETDESEESWGW